MQEVKAIIHQVQVASLVSATAPTFAYVNTPGQLSESCETPYEAVHNNTHAHTHLEGTEYTGLADTAGQPNFF